MMRSCYTLNNLSKNALKGGVVISLFDELLEFFNKANVLGDICVLVLLAAPLFCPIYG